MSVGMVLYEVRKPVLWLPDLVLVAAALVPLLNGAPVERIGAALGEDATTEATDGVAVTVIVDLTVSVTVTPPHPLEPLPTTAAAPLLAADGTVI